MVVFFFLSLAFLYKFPTSYILAVFFFNFHVISICFYVFVSKFLFKEDLGPDIQSVSGCLKDKSQ